MTNKSFINMNLIKKTRNCVTDQNLMINKISVQNPENLSNDKIKFFLKNHTELSSYGK